MKFHGHKVEEQPSRSCSIFASPQPARVLTVYHCELSSEGLSDPATLGAFRAPSPTTTQPSIDPLEIRETEDALAATHMKAQWQPKLVR